MSEAFSIVEPVQRVGGRVAVLVDGENIAHSELVRIEAAACKLGLVSIRRVYGDMISRLAWEAETSFHVIHTGKGRGKNVADMCLTIDAVDLAHRGLANYFVIASNDGDFAPLATWLREAGFSVVGVGQAAASQQLQAACGDFRLPEAKAVKKSPVIPLSNLDERIKKAIMNNALSLVTLGNAMRGASAKQQTGHATWRAYLATRKDIYDVQKTGQHSVVRWIGP